MSVLTVKHFYLNCIEQGVLKTDNGGLGRDHKHKVITIFLSFFDNIAPVVIFQEGISHFQACISIPRS